MRLPKVFSAAGRLALRKRALEKQLHAEGHSLTEAKGIVRQRFARDGIENKLVDRAAVETQVVKLDSSPERETVRCRPREADLGSVADARDGEMPTARAAKGSGDSITWDKGDEHGRKT